MTWARGGLETVAVPAVLAAIMAITVLSGCESSPPSEPVAQAPAPAPEPAQVRAPQTDRTGTDGPAPIPPAPKEAAEQPAEHMRDHFSVVTQARDAVIRGDMEAAHGPLVWLSQHSYHGELPATWQPHVVRLQAAAKRADAAMGMSDLASELALVAVECGACHTALGKPLSLEPEGFEELDESDHETTRERMHRHLWAANRMWEALIGPDPKRFALAGEVLLEALPIADAPAAMRARIEGVQVLAKRAKAAKTTADQAQVLGAFMAQCAACHKDAMP